ncbi:MFS transporter [[Acholeplasma] multilocale]|uniref:MFS transporter n=1 Tax=[Acholeplasma] multilocale TaxID=264638 RepID=UPI00054FE02C|nr:MFS transporter [[Acholeplasma] multilocale]
MKLKKIEVKNIKSFFKTNLPIIILALTDVVIFAIPLYMENFIPNLNSSLHITASQYSWANAIYGFVQLPCYLLGSYLGDKFKSKHLLVLSLIIISILGVWYMTLPFNSTKLATMIQLYIIFAGFAFAIAGLLWAPLWKVVKNHNTAHLVGEEKEKQVGKNNGLQGGINGLLGLVLALFGTMLMSLANAKKLPTIEFGDKSINMGFFILLAVYVTLIIASLLLTVFLIKGIDDNHEKTFTLKSLIRVVKNWKIWLLGTLVLGVYMLQMGLSSYMNYLTNIFLVPALVVSLLGTFRTYVMRFLISPYAGKKADKSHSYILLICLGLFLGMVLVVVAMLLPGFNNSFENKGKVFKTIMAVAASLNLMILGLLTWAIVTIRWSPIGAELKIDNTNYATGVGVVSVIAFTPNAFFRFIKAIIEKQYSMEWVDTATGHVTQVANQTGNQLILLTVVIFGMLGLIAGLTLYCLMYKNHDKFVFRKLMRSR